MRIANIWKSKAYFLLFTAATCGTLLAFPDHARASGPDMGSECPPGASYNDLVASGEGGAAGYQAVNEMRNGSGGYLASATGRYQMNYAALVSVGFVSGPTPSMGPGEWGGVTWSPESGVSSREEFLNSPAAQDAAFAAFTNNLLSSIEGSYSPGSTVNGTTMTSGGAAYAAHMLGAGGFKQWAASGFQPSGLNAQHAADHNMTLEQYNQHLMNRVAEGGCFDPTAITINPNDKLELPPIYLMEWAPKGIAPVMLPGRISRSGPT